jgi:hypothetical protein
MAKAHVGGGVQAIKATNYYRSWFNLTANNSTAQARKSLFYGQATTDARNDLLAMGGRLPQGKDGWLTAVFFRLRQQPITKNSVIIAPHFLEAIRDMELTVKVNGSDVCTLPIWACNHPPGWTQGGFSIAAADTVTTTGVQNGGYMLQFQPHQIQVDQSLEISVENPGGIVLPAVTGSEWKVGGAAGSDNLFACEVGVQISDRRLV